MPVATPRIWMSLSMCTSTQTSQSSPKARKRAKVFARGPAAEVSVQSVADPLQSQGASGPGQPAASALGSVRGSSSSP